MENTTANLLKRAPKAVVNPLDRPLAQAKKDYFRAFFASLAILVTLLAQLFIPRNTEIFTKVLPWYSDLLWLSLAITLIGWDLLHFRDF